VEVSGILKFWKRKENKMSQSTPQDLSQLFQTGVSNGVISAETAQALQVVGIGNLIQGGLGVSANDVNASEVTLVQIVQDDSGSMYGNTQVAIDGHNLVLDALKATKQKDGILFGTTLLNRGVVNPFNKLDNVTPLNNRNYTASGGTPLNGTALAVLGTVLAKTIEFDDNGVAVRSITVFITDGGNTDRVKSSEDKKQVEEMLKTEMHIVAGIGIDDGYTDFTKVFSDMGIRPEWILTPKNNASEIRKCFQFMSQSAIRASQAVGNLGSIGGFGSP
jgi:uncharacterized protein YegL